MQSYRRQLILTAMLSIVVAACSTGYTSIRKTYEDDEYAREVYGNLLVIAVAGSWDSRAQFERDVVSGLRAEGVEAKPYSLVGGGEFLKVHK